MKKRFAIFALIIIAVGNIALSQQVDLKGLIERKGARRVRIAVPELTIKGLKNARLMTAASTIISCLKYDLDFSLVFSVIGENEMNALPPFDDKVFSFSTFEGIGAESLVAGNIRLEGGKIILEARVYDVKTKQMVLGKRYRGEPSQARFIAHNLADEIVLRYTGKPGIAKSKIAFSSNKEEAKELFLMDYDGANIRKVTNFKSITIFPALTPTGDKIAFTSFFSGFPRLYLLTLAPGKTKMLFGGPGLNSTPSWSPDGRKVAFTSSKDGNAEIYILDIDTGKLRRVTHSPAIDTNPCFSPTGREIAFTSDRGGSPQIYIMDVDGANIRRLTYQGRYNEGAAWSPDGLKIAYCSRIGVLFDIFMIDLKDNIPYRLTIDAGSNECPVWSPDGKHIAFSSNRNGRYHIYVMNADGAEPRRLTNGGNNFTPSWSRGE
jgi:TolB protein